MTLSDTNSAIANSHPAVVKHTRQSLLVGQQVRTVQLDALSACSTYICVARPRHQVRQLSSDGAAVSAVALRQAQSMLLKGGRWPTL